MASRSKEISDNIGSRIKIYRKQSGFTQKTLAEKLYKSESTVRMWELGKSEPDIGTIVRLSEILNVPVELLLNVDKDNLSEPDQVLRDVALYIQDHPAEPETPVQQLKREFYSLVDQMDEDQLREINNYIEFIANKKK
ncbi:MAG: helix-turn-helix domain-containing protein [Clostridia bacterium]|nr:helix-turn-helix domain-containing protein [Clostridia bacterium]